MRLTDCFQNIIPLSSSRRRGPRAGWNSSANIALQARRERSRRTRWPAPSPSPSQGTSACRRGAMPGGHESRGPNEGGSRVGQGYGQVGTGNGRGMGDRLAHSSRLVDGKSLYFGFVIPISNECAAPAKSHFLPIACWRTKRPKERTINNPSGLWHGISRERMLPCHTLTPINCKSACLERRRMRPIGA
ncbi:MAG: hypothetical protein H6R00_5001 [Proteobacteria bacterium]|nr:hypothetical protein [Pseudomonadota bacterium]